MRVPRRLHRAALMRLQFDLVLRRRTLPAALLQAVANLWREEEEEICLCVKMRREAHNTVPGQVTCTTVM